jgi:hypothetical protein
VSFSQVIDCGYVPVPRKTLEFPEKNSVNEVVFEKEWRRDSCRKNGSCVTNRNLRKIRRLRTSHSIILGIPNWHFWHANQGEAIKEFIESAGDGLRADRERAMLCVAYETLARRAELGAIEVRDIDFHPNGNGQVLIRRGKTDAEGQGRLAYLSRDGALAQSVARACGSIGRGGISAVDWSKSNRGRFKPRQHRTDLFAMDRDA